MHGHKVELLCISSRCDRGRENKESDCGAVDFHGSSYIRGCCTVEYAVQVEEEPDVTEIVELRRRDRRDSRSFQTMHVSGAWRAVALALGEE